MQTGDRIDVTLDCVVEEKDGRQVARVFVRLADAPPSEGGSHPPAPHAGAQRNVVQRWLGVADDQTFMAAFAIDLGPVETVHEGRRVVASREVQRHTCDRCGYTASLADVSLFSGVGVQAECRDTAACEKRTRGAQRLRAAVEAVEWARNSGDGTVSLGDIDELTEAANATA